MLLMIKSGQATLDHSKFHRFRDFVFVKTEPCENMSWHPTPSHEYSYNFKTSRHQKKTNVKKVHRGNSIVRYLLSQVEIINFTKLIFN